MALTEAGHNGARHTVTGPAAITQFEQAQAIGEEIGRMVRFEEIAPEDARQGLFARKGSCSSRRMGGDRLDRRCAECSDSRLPGARAGSSTIEFDDAVGRAMAFVADGGQAAPDYSIGAAMAAAAGYVAQGGLNRAAIAKVSAETRKLVSAAESGGFKITEKGVEPLRKVLADMSEHLRKLKCDAVHLSQAPQVGAHPYGKAVAAHDQKVASEAAGSAAVVFEQVSQDKDADEALARAAGLYKGVEVRAVDATRTIQA